MRNKINFILLGFAVSFTFLSCNYITWITVNGKLKEKDTFRYSSNSTSYKKIGRKIVIDTFENYIVSKTRYKESIGCFHFELIRKKTITYNKEHKRIKKYVVRKGSHKTIYYLKNQMTNEIQDEFNNSFDTLRTNTPNTKK